MSNDRLYKYLDVDGGLMMLYHSNLMFTNATQLNDPFDCHPALKHYQHVSVDCYKGWPNDVITHLEYNKALNRRENTYICSLSKVHDSITMWSYYSKHSGICIGLDMEKVRNYTEKMVRLFYGCAELEVQYQDVINGHNTVNCPNDFLCYHFATKAKEWQHEKEVRLVAYEPSPRYMRLLLEKDKKEGIICQKVKQLFCKHKKAPIDWGRAFLDIGGECFESVYLGINMDKKDKEEIINAARKCNPCIKIYQMIIDPEAFRLNEKLIKA